MSIMGALLELYEREIELADSIALIYIYICQ